MPSPAPNLATSSLDERLERFGLGDDPRIAVRRGGALAPDPACVLLWVQRAQRGRDNPALDLAINLGNALGLPVVAFLGLMPRYPRATLRAYEFLFAGVKEFSADLLERRVTLVVRLFPDHHLIPFAKEARAALIVGDENPLRETEGWRRTVASQSPVPFITVETECLVPPSLFPKREFAARTLRPKYHRLWDSFMTRGVDVRAKFVHPSPPRGCDPASLPVPEGWRVDRSVRAVATFPSGPRSARKGLASFVSHRLPGYAENRNHPDLAFTSRLSPWLHFGHLGPREVVSAVQQAGAADADGDAFLEEFLVRRELAYNYVRYEPKYDELSGCPAWALKTLDEHRSDPRPILYSAEQLRDAVTHDDLWNAAQREMVLSGHMHGYVRMYWAKKILEWSPSPEAAFDIAVSLNDAYELDGRDPNGFTGIAWAIGGLHDRPWAPARPIFGMVRFMSYSSTGRKFDKKAYIARVDSLDPSLNLF